MTGWIDAILVLVVLEAAGLTALHRTTGRGLAPATLLPTLLAGALLLAAMRLALGGAAFPWVGLCLLGAGLAHVADLRRRWHPARGPSRLGD